MKEVKFDGFRIDLGDDRHIEANTMSATCDITGYIDSGRSCETRRTENGEQRCRLTSWNKGGTHDKPIYTVPVAVNIDDGWRDLYVSECFSTPEAAESARKDNQ